MKKNLLTFYMYYIQKQIQFFCDDEILQYFRNPNQRCVSIEANHIIEMIEIEDKYKQAFKKFTIKILKQLQKEYLGNFKIDITILTCLN